MVLYEVLRVIYDELKPYSVSQSRLYMMLFCDNKNNNDSSVYENTAKKIFSKQEKRPLDRTLTARIQSLNGFQTLCDSIATNVLSNMQTYDKITDNLNKLIDNDSFLKENDKNFLKNLYKNDDIATTSRFIALCILCSNLNLQISGMDIRAETSYPLELKKYIASSYSLLQNDLYDATIKNYHDMRRDGARFASFNIIESILPKGYLTHLDYDAKAKLKDGSAVSALETCLSSRSHIAIIGDGGIGKTTLLQKVIECKFSDKSAQIPFFIELNRCPHNIVEWYDGVLLKTNFITRYIAGIYEGHLSLDAVKKENIDAIEIDMQKTPTDGLPRYLLLLDGFNEVYSGDDNKIRVALSNEIAVLSSFDNVQIITTSRRTQTADYASKFENLPLIGLESSDIIKYLRDSGKSNTDINLISANKRLMECLRIPLYICMFSSTSNTGKTLILPETVGEIFYNFFHKNGSFYNIKKRAHDTKTNPFDDLQTSFILDFITPYIGYHYEDNDTFDMSKNDIKKLIVGAIETIDATCKELTDLPFPEYSYDTEELCRVASSLAEGHAQNDNAILYFLQDYFGLFYKQTLDHTPKSGKKSDRVRFSFCHHQFRDYFSAMWDVQIFRILPMLRIHSPYEPDSYFAYCDKLGYFIDKAYLSPEKAELVSEILQEHRNKPTYDLSSQKWYIPAPLSDDQTVLTDALDFCRRIKALGDSSKFLTNKILTCILAGRKELSGMDLQNLDLTTTNLFNVNCCRYGHDEYLFVNFRGSEFSDMSFAPENHQDLVVSHLYHRDFCFTLDMSGVIKCWNVLTGTLYNQYEPSEGLDITDISADQYMKSSPNGRYIAIIFTGINNGERYPGILCYDVAHTEILKYRDEIIFSEFDDDEIVDFFFTRDSDGIIVICRHKRIYSIYGYEIDRSGGNASHSFNKELNLTLKFNLSSSVLNNKSLICMGSIHDNHAFIYTSSYIPTFEEYFDDDDKEADYDVENFYSNEIYELSLRSAEFRLIYSFDGFEKYSPTISYLPGCDMIIFYNQIEKCLAILSCQTKEVHIIFAEIAHYSDYPLTHIHPHEKNPNAFYAMYPDCVLLCEIGSNDNAYVISSSHTAIIADLLENGSELSKLSFKTAVAPYNDHYILGFGENTYEWNARKDTLYPRYNLTYFSIKTIIPDKTRGLIIIVYQNNHIAVFDNDFINLYRAVSFNENGYHIEDAVYSEYDALLALVFVRGDHEKIILVDINSSMDFTVFSTDNPDETILTIDFHAKEPKLLITTQSKCCIFDAKKDSLATIRHAAKNERLLYGSFIRDDVEILITPHTVADEKDFLPRCEYLIKDINTDTAYTLSYYYIVPKLEKSLAPYFITEFNDLGLTGPLNEHEIQKYWITGGFFLEDENHSIEFPNLKYYWASGELKEDQTIPHGKFIFFAHDYAITVAESLYENTPYGLTFSYLDGDNKTAVFLDRKQHLCISYDYRNETYESINKKLSKKHSFYNDNPLWEHAAAWYKDKIVGCAESETVFILNLKTGKEEAYADHYPGISVLYCNFDDCKLPETTLEYLQY